ncbi:MAG: hypothetical protein LBP83_04895 [Dysgonamonadaceae bacterium]|nr:hypothetical protein [Dysgonamonadaceae bacterium]
MNRIKIKTLARKGGKYTRELSIVVVGIAITLSINNWFATKTERKDTTLYLDAVTLELKTNLESLSKIG